MKRIILIAVWVMLGGFGCQLPVPESVSSTQRVSTPFELSREKTIGGLTSYDDYSSPSSISGSKKTRYASLEGGEPEADPPEGEEGHPNRKVIYTGKFTVLSPNIEDSIDKLIEYVSSLKGHLSLRRDSMIVCRVPAKSFQEVVKALPRYGQLLKKEIQASDVTRNYFDLELRINTAEKALERLVELLKKAEKVEDILKIEKEIHRLTESLERMKGEMRHLQDQIALSTLTIEFRTNAPPPRHHRHRTQSPFPWIRRVGIQSLLEEF